MAHRTPGSVFRPATITSRRRRNSARIASTGAWSPVIASTPAHWVKAAVQELELVIKRLICGTRSTGITVAKAPTSHGVGLGKAIEQNSPLGHSRQTGDAVVLALVEQTGVDIIGEDHQIVRDRDLGDLGQILGLQYPAGRIGRRVDDDHLGSWSHGAAQALDI